MSGPNQEMNFLSGILNAKHNLVHIVAYLRFYKNSETYKDYLEMYVPKLKDYLDSTDGKGEDRANYKECKECYTEFFAELERVNTPVEETEEEVVEETVVSEVETAEETVVEEVAEEKVEEVKEVEEEKAEEVAETVAEEAAAEGAGEVPKMLTEEEFRDLSAGDQRELVKDKVKEEDDDSNIEKRLALYLSTPDDATDN